MEFIKYQSNDTLLNAQSNGPSSNAKSSIKQVFPFKSFFHYLTEELLVNPAPKNEELKLQSCNYKLEIIQFLHSLLLHYGEVTIALLFELDAKAILDMDIEGSRGLSSSTTTSTSESNIVDMVDAEDSHTTDASSSTKIVDRSHSKSSTTSSSSSAVVNTLKRKHSEETSSKSTSSSYYWKEFSLLKYLESVEHAHGNRSNNPPNTLDRNNMVRLSKVWFQSWRAVDEVPLHHPLSAYEECLVKIAIIMTILLNACIGKLHGLNKSFISHILRGDPWSQIPGPARIPGWE